MKYNKTKQRQTYLNGKNKQNKKNCGGLNENSPHWLTRSGLIGGVALLE